MKENIKSLIKGDDTRVRKLKDTGVKITENEHRVYRIKQFQQFLV